MKKPNLVLLENENILFEAQPKLALATYLMTKKGIGLLIAVLIISIVFFTSFEKNEIYNSILKHHAFLYAFLFLIIFSTLTYLWLKTSISRYWYIFTNQRCMLYSGFIIKNKRLIPYQRIVDVDLSQGPLESIFNIASVNIAEQSSNSVANSASSTQGGWGSLFRLNPSIVLGLSYDNAEKLTQLISEHITKR